MTDAELNHLVGACFLRGGNAVSRLRKQIDLHLVACLARLSTDRKAIDAAIEGAFKLFRQEVRTWGDDGRNWPRWIVAQAMALLVEAAGLVSNWLDRLAAEGPSFSADRDARAFVFYEILSMDGRCQAELLERLRQNLDAQSECLARLRRALIEFRSR